VPTDAVWLGARERCVGGGSQAFPDRRRAGRSTAESLHRPQGLGREAQVAADPAVLDVPEPDEPEDPEEPESFEPEVPDDDDDDDESFEPEPGSFEVVVASDEGEDEVDDESLEVEAESLVVELPRLSLR
jgi:hypothetical protein